MVKINQIVCYFFCVAVMISCSSDDSSSDSNSFQGEWSGSFVENRGQETDNGVWSVTVSATGEINGTATSFVFEDIYQTVGTVSSDGDFRATAGGGASSGAIFIGTLNGNSGSGTWTNEDAELSGTWQGTRQ